jgi:hypothetical protein
MKKAIIENTEEKVILNDDGTWEYYESIEDILNYGVNDLITTESDKMTNDTFYRFKNTIKISNEFNNNRISFIAHTEKNEEYLFLGIFAYGAGDCIAEDDKIILLFKDKQTITLENTNDYNCENHFTLFLSKALFEKTIYSLKTVQLESIRVYTSEGYVEVDLNEIQSLKIQKSIKLLLELSAMNL